MLTGENIEWIDLPHEPGSRIKIRMLSWKQLQAARDERTRMAMASMADVDEKLMGAIQQLKAPGDVEIDEEEESSAIGEYDRGELLKSAIVEWTYEADVNAETCDELDETTSIFMAERIIAMSVRSDEEGED